MLLTPGTRLGPYEILAPIDAGGMGEVWEARDTWRTRVGQDRDGIRAEVARLASKRRRCIGFWLTTRAEISRLCSEASAAVKGGEIMVGK
jgi:hypothetical protein